MRLRGILFWPIYRLADWVDDNPVSAIGAILAIGALAVLAASIVLGVNARASTIDSASTTLLAQTVVERPAYPVAALVGVAIVLFYDG